MLASSSPPGRNLERMLRAAESRSSRSSTWGSALSQEITASNEPATLSPNARKIRHPEVYRDAEPPGFLPGAPDGGRAYIRRRKLVAVKGETYGLRPDAARAIQDRELPDPDLGAEGPVQHLALPAHHLVPVAEDQMVPAGQPVVEIPHGVVVHRCLSLPVVSERDGAVANQL